MSRINLSLRSLVLSSTIALLTACGGSSNDETPPPPPPPPVADTYNLSGTMVGLEGSIDLEADSEVLTVSENGSFSFTNDFEDDSTVTVSISEQPENQTCEITSEDSFTFSGSDIDDLTVECETNLYSLSGTVSGLDGELTLSAQSDELIITDNGSFTFNQQFENGVQVDVAIAQAPESQTCEITSAASFTFDNSDIDALTLECEDINYSVAGEADGMSRPITVYYTIDGNEQSTEVEAGSSFTFIDEVAAGSVISFYPIDEIGHTCEITPNEITVSNGTESVAISCETFGSADVLVSDYSNGDAIEEAVITVFTEQDGEIITIDSALSDAEGRAVIEGVGYQPRIVIKAEAISYATRSDVVATSEQNNSANLTVSMLPIDITEQFEASAGGQIVDPATGMAVELPADAFVDASGELYTGVVTAELTDLDASSDTNIMPGEYVALNPDTQALQYMESFGAVSAEFRDSNNDSLNLASGVEAILSIPLATRSQNPPNTVPYVSFNEQTGRWLVEGEGTLTTDDDGNRVYVGSVSHFSSWNADVLYDSVNINGCVINEESDQLLAGLRVQSSGVDYIGASHTYTDNAGDFTIPVRPNSQVLLAVVDNEGVSSTQVVNTGNEDLTLPECTNSTSGALRVSLTWGANPSDLDTHFMGPAIENGTASDERFRIYFGNKSETVDNVTMFLDVDDTSSYGPEVLTVPSYPLPGTYRYSVHHYSGSSTIFESPTRLSVQFNGRTYTFAPEEPQETRNSELNTWVAFDIVVDNDGNATLQEVNEYRSLGSDDISAESSQQAIEKLLNNSKQ